MTYRVLFLLVITPGCAYRYGTGYFMNDDAKTLATTSTVHPTPEPIPCPEAKSTIEVKNTLDNKTNTITTTATSTHTRVDPCFQ